MINLTIIVGNYTYASDRERNTLDKYEYKIRADEIKDLIATGDYAQAADIADTIDWRRVKSVMMLCTISDLYKINRRYEDAKNMLLLAYERRPGGKTICYSLCELCIKTEEYVQAINYYKEFVQVAPKDPGRYILQYKLYEAQDVGLEERIGVLEELKKRDYREKWAYELAYLYHRVGLATRCVEECDELILWFGDGKYVIKAMELKMLHEPLTPDQQAKYDHRFAKNGITEQSVSEAESSAEESQELWAEPSAVSQPGQQRVVYPEVKQPETKEEPEEMDIQVKTMDVGEYNTINLQAELAAGLKEVLAADQKSREDAVTRSILSPMVDADTESLTLPEIDEVNEGDFGPEAEVMEGSEVFFGATGDLGNLQEHSPEQPAGNSMDVEEILPEEEETIPSIDELNETVPTGGEPHEKTPSAEELDETARTVMNELRMESEEQVLKAQPPKELAGVLSQESDGQIRLVVPESEAVEKQITGQMSIEDILTEWEKLKKVNEAKRQEEVRQHVLEQTGTMFTEFEAAVRDGLLEQLESQRAAAEEEMGEPVEIVKTKKPEEVESVAEPEETGEAQDAAGEEYDKIENFEVIEDITESEAEERHVESVEPEKTVEVEAAEISEEKPEAEETEEVTAAETTAQPEETEEAQDAAGEEYDEIEEIEEIEEEVADAAEAEIIEEAAKPENAEKAIEEYGEVEEIEEIEEAEVVSDAETAEEEPEAEESEEATAEETAGQEVEATAEPEETVEREKPKVRALTREEKELYGPFIQSRSGKERLVKAIDNISMAAYTGNIIITGEEGMDTLSLAKNMIREVQMTDSNFSGKVAKISGQSMNSRNVEETLEHLKNGALIVQKASRMEKPAVEALCKTLQKENFGIIVALEDTRKAIGKLLKVYPELQESFTARMDVEAMSNDSLAAFGRQYARKQEYSIDELGMLALHTCIEERQTIDHVVTVLDVKEIVDAAIHHANRKTLGHFFDILFAKRYDDEDMIILTEKDFV